MEAIRSPAPSLTSIWRLHARWRGHRPAIVAPSRSVSWCELDEIAGGIAATLAAADLRAGARVALLAENSIAAIAAIMALAGAGLVSVPLSPLLAADALARAIDDCEAGALIVSHAHADQAAAARAQLRAEVPVFALGFDSPGWPRADTSRRRDEAIAHAAGPGADDPFVIIYSSGTTGEPKGIVHSHGARYLFASAHAIELGISAESRALIVTPLHTNASWIMLLPTLMCGGTIVLESGFVPSAVLATIARQRITHCFMVPVQIAAIAAQHKAVAGDFSSLRCLLSAGSTLAPELARIVRERMTPHLYNLYGCTEGVGTLLRPNDFDASADSVGRPILGTTIEILSDDNALAAPGDAGEIIGHGPGMMLGYHARAAETRDAVWVAGNGRVFMRTGDIGTIGDDGCVRLIDRKKDMIVSGGLNVYPADIEAVMRAHPAIADAAVIGRASEKWGEEPVAFVIGRADADLDPVEVIAWTNQRVSKHQRIAAVIAVEALPRNALGQVVKATLRSGLRSGALATPMGSQAT